MSFIVTDRPGSTIATSGQGSFRASGCNAWDWSLILEFLRLRRVSVAPANPLD